MRRILETQPEPPVMYQEAQRAMNLLMTVAVVRPPVSRHWHDGDGPSAGQSKRMILLPVCVICGSCKDDDYYLSRMGYVLSKCFALFRTAIQSARYLIEVQRKR